MFTVFTNKLQTIVITFIFILILFKIYCVGSLIVVYFIGTPNIKVKRINFKNKKQLRMFEYVSCLVIPMNLFRWNKGDVGVVSEMVGRPISKSIAFKLKEEEGI